MADQAPPQSETADVAATAAAASADEPVVEVVDLLGFSNDSSMGAVAAEETDQAAPSNYVPPMTTSFNDADPIASTPASSSTTATTTTTNPQTFDSPTKTTDLLDFGTVGPPDASLSPQPPPPPPPPQQAQPTSDGDHDLLGFGGVGAEETKPMTGNSVEANGSGGGDVPAKKEEAAEEPPSQPLAPEEEQAQQQPAGDADDGGARDEEPSMSANEISQVQANNGDNGGSGGHQAAVAEDSKVSPSISGSVEDLSSEGRTTAASDEAVAQPTIVAYQEEAPATLIENKNETVENGTAVADGAAPEQRSPSSVPLPQGQGPAAQTDDARAAGSAEDVEGQTAESDEMKAAELHDPWAETKSEGESSDRNGDRNGKGGSGGRGGFAAMLARAAASKTSSPLTVVPPPPPPTPPNTAAISPATRKLSSSSPPVPFANLISRRAAEVKDEVSAPKSGGPASFASLISQRAKKVVAKHHPRGIRQQKTEENGGETVAPPGQPQPPSSSTTVTTAGTTAAVPYEKDRATPSKAGFEGPEGQNSTATEDRHEVGPTIAPLPPLPKATTSSAGEEVQGSSTEVDSAAGKVSAPVYDDNREAVSSSPSSAPAQQRTEGKEAGGTAIESGAPTDVKNGAAPFAQNGGKDEASKGSDIEEPASVTKEGAASASTGASAAVYDEGARQREEGEGPTGEDGATTAEEVMPKAETVVPTADEIAEERDDDVSEDQVDGGTITEASPLAEATAATAEQEVGDQQQPASADEAQVASQAAHAPSEERGEALESRDGSEQEPQQTQPDAEAWQAMGLDLNDALQQILTLTEERDAALARIGDNSRQKDGSEGGEEKSDCAEKDVLLVELQSSLHDQMTRRAELEARLRETEDTVRQYEGQLEKYSGLEDDLEKANASLVHVVSEKSSLETEVGKLREAREDSERKEAVLSNRLNEAKKKEASKANMAGRFEADNDALRDELAKTKAELETVTAARDKLEASMEKLKKKCVERVKQAEAALLEERSLNEERKKKMKVFVETKAEELRVAKESTDEMRVELDDALASLRESRERSDYLHNEVTAAQTKNRELQRDMTRMKKNSEELHKMGDNLELELQKSAQETEEHKNKRLTAKHELMTMVRALEAERSVSGKLRDGIKFTFTPKALSQQQILAESLQDFEAELLKLSRRLGKPLPPSTTAAAAAGGTENGSSAETDQNRTENEGVNGVDSPNVGNKAGKRKGAGRGPKSEVDSNRLLSNLEGETQRVSQGIMALTNSVERLHFLLEDSDGRSCIGVLSEYIGGTIGQARHQRLRPAGGESQSEQDETVSMTSFGSAVR